MIVRVDAMKNFEIKGSFKKKKLGIYRLNALQRNRL